jgi:hypothetical protein
MKIRMPRHRVMTDVTSGPKPAPVAPAPRRVSSEHPPRVWSLLLAPGFSNDRR